MNLEGEEAGVVYFLFNREILRNVFSKAGFRIEELKIYKGYSNFQLN